MIRKQNDQTNGGQENSAQTTHLLVEIHKKGKFGNMGVGETAILCNAISVVLLICVERTIKCLTRNMTA